MSSATKYTLLNLPNTFTVFGTDVTDHQARQYVNQMQSAYNTFGGIGLYKKVKTLIYYLKSNPTVWQGNDYHGIVAFWRTLNWGQLDSTKRTNLFNVTNTIS